MVLRQATLVLVELVQMALTVGLVLQVAAVVEGGAVSLGLGATLLEVTEDRVVIQDSGPVDQVVEAEAAVGTMSRHLVRLAQQDQLAAMGLTGGMVWMDHYILAATPPLQKSLTKEKVEVVLGLAGHFL